jgi:hypothetical protein
MANAPPPPPQLGGGGSDVTKQLQQEAKKKSQTPIGVPYGYMAQGQADVTSTAGMLSPMQQALANSFAPGSFGTSQAGAGRVAPRYHEGDEFLPGSLSPDVIAMMQKELVDAGILDPKGVLMGRYDAKTQAAYKKLLGYANQTGQDMATTLKRYMALQKQQGETGPQPQPLPIQLTNDADLQAVFRNSAMNLIGKNLTPDQTQSMVQAYHAIQTWTQTQTANLQREAQLNQQGIRTEHSGQTVVTQDAPTAANYSEQQIRATQPGQVIENQIVGQGGLMDSFNSLLSQWNKS